MIAKNMCMLGLQYWFRSFKVKQMMATREKFYQINSDKNLLEVDLLLTNTW